MVKTNSRSLSILILLTSILLSAAQVQALGRQLTDDENQQLTVDQPYSRIISLYPAHTENLVELGAEHLLIGIGTSDNYPPAIQDKPRYSYRDNVEKFLAAKPDLILIRPMISRSQPELMGKLRASGITIVSLQPTGIDQLFPYWRMLAVLTGKEPAAEEMIGRFRRGLEKLQSTVPENTRRPRVYFESIHRKMKTFAPEAISIFVLTMAGGTNIAADAVGRNQSNIAPYGKERILSKAEEIDVFLSQNGRMNRVSSRDIYQEPGFQLIKAVREKQVYFIKEELVSRPTMRLLHGIQQIQTFLYPDHLSSRHTPAGSQ